jgi:Helix-turn-helix domain
MRRTRVLWEAYVTRFEDALDRYKQGRLTAEEAGELLGLSGRRFRRQCARFEDDGIDGLRDKRLGRVSERRAPESGLEHMRRLYREDMRTLRSSTSTRSYTNDTAITWATR